LGHVENGFEIKDGTAYQHSNYKYYKNLFGEQKFNNYLKFSIVRNPYTKIISEYFYLPNRGHKSNRTFDEFLEYTKTIVKNRRYNNNDLYRDHYKPQYTYICDSNYKIKVDKLFYFEKYYEVDEFLLKNFNITDKRIYLKGEYDKSDIVLNAAQKETIYEIYKEDFDIFKYDDCLGDGDEESVD